ncbi:hypothetical protein [Streptomyces sp. NPDC051776]|uniref:hypothetical protein n=1 Tax=Streptomyces sp. NPDC051776 TaxID=3155414 RepID=UPI00342A14F3
MSRLILSEWIKFRTVNTTTWCLFALALPILGVAGLVAVDEKPRGPLPVEWLVTHSQFGLVPGQLAVVVLAVTAVGSEYSTGTIRSSLTAVPWRARWLAAKAAVLALVVLTAGVLLSFAAFAVVRVSVPEVSGSVLDPDVLRALVGAGLYLGALAVLGLGVATMLRSTTGGVVAMFTLILLVPVLIAPTPLRRATAYLPGVAPPSAGWPVTRVGQTVDGLGTWTGYGVLCAWAVAAMAGAVWALSRRDA